MVLSNQGLDADEVTYFLNIAVIAGTLLGLSFVALAFFLVDLLKRYEGTALPVFRDRDALKPSNLRPPHSLTDREILDGDPLVVFIAFSVAVTWNFFLLPLTIGLTAAWKGAKLWILALELALFVAILAFSLLVRNSKIRELNPYRTREELLWPFLSGLVLFFYGVSAVLVIASALPQINAHLSRLLIWNRWGISNVQASLFLIKTVCVLSLLVATYTTNKDMFIFFKSVAAERMRHRWLHSFFHERYGDLQKRVESVLLDIPPEARESDPLNQRWNDGCPEIICVHEALKNTDDSTRLLLWKDLVRRHSGLSWMLDIPSIAEWESQVEHELNSREFPGRA